MDPKLERLGIHCSADEITEYIDRFNFLIYDRKPSDKKAIKGVFLSAAVKKAFTLLRTLAYTETLRDSSITKIQAALL